MMFSVRDGAGGAESERAREREGKGEGEGERERGITVDLLSHDEKETIASRVGGCHPAREIERERERARERESERARERERERERERKRDREIERERHRGRRGRAPSRMVEWGRRVRGTSLPSSVLVVCSVPAGCRRAASPLSVSRGECAG